MPHFSPISRARLETCNLRLQNVLNAAIKNGPDFSVLCGHRSEADQNRAFDEGMSKVRWPNSKHNLIPSRAVDIAPYPIDWDDERRFRDLAYYVMGVADTLGVKLVWGGNWRTFKDMPHFELTE